MYSYSCTVSINVRTVVALSRPTHVAARWVQLRQSRQGGGRERGRDNQRDDETKEAVKFEGGWEMVRKFAMKFVRALAQAKPI